MANDSDKKLQDVNQTEDSSSKDPLEKESRNHADDFLSSNQKPPRTQDDRQFENPDSKQTDFESSVLNRSSGSRTDTTFFENKNVEIKRQNDFFSASNETTQNQKINEQMSSLGQSEEHSHSEILSKSKKINSNDFDSNKSGLRHSAAADPIDEEMISDTTDEEFFNDQDEDLQSRPANSKDHSKRDGQFRRSKINSKGIDGLSNSNLFSQEARKRKRELLIVFVTAFLFLLLTWFEVRLFSISQQLPFVHSIFFFGLVNFNIILLLLLLFLIFRNVVKVFVERKGKVFGSSLKGKLIAAFVSFSTIPTLLIFITSVFYINSSFDKWFSVKMAGVLKSSLEVSNAYYFNAKKKNYHFAHEVAKEIYRTEDKLLKNKLEKLREVYSLDALEYYPSLLTQRVLVISDDDNLPIIPPVSLEFLQKGLKSQVDASTIHQFGDGNLVRVIVPVREGAKKGAIVVSSFVPLSLISKMNDISSAYNEFRDINPLEYPLKSIYMIILFLMTFVILLAATWFGFHLAKQLSIPLVQLGKATRRVADGDYTPVAVKTGSEEIHSLVDSFNQMTNNLAKSEKEVKAANASLRTTLANLDKHTRYVEVVLRNVSAGVISVDSQGKVTTVNRRAGDLLKISIDQILGRSVRELLTLDYFRMFAQLLKTMAEHKIESIQKEFKFNVDGEEIPLQMTLSILKDEMNAEIGKILVFDDMTPILNAQRSAAWTEVARRIAHEIKNPLTPIKLSAERLQRKFGSSITDPAFADCTRMIIRQTEDLKNLVNEFSNFARLPQTKPVIASMSQVINDLLTLFKQSHPHIDYQLKLDNRLPDFKFDPDQMRRVLFNLVDNAVAAVSSEESKLVEISTIYDENLKTLKLSVSDSGVGIEPHQRSRVFEPYFSTKEGGTGLGLAIVKRIVEDHSGFIRAIANDPKGTKFTIELPVNEVGAWRPS